MGAVNVINRLLCSCIKVSNGQVIQVKSSKVNYLKKGQVSRGKSSILGIGQVREKKVENYYSCLLYTSPSPRDRTRSRMPSSA